MMMMMMMMVMVMIMMINKRHMKNKYPSKNRSVVISSKTLEMYGNVDLQPKGVVVPVAIMCFQ